MANDGMHINKSNKVFYGKGRVPGFDDDKYYIIDNNVEFRKYYYDMMDSLDLAFRAYICNLSDRGAMFEFPYVTHRLVPTRKNVYLRFDQNQEHALALPEKEDMKYIMYLLVDNYRKNITPVARTSTVDQGTVDLLSDMKKELDGPFDYDKEKVRDFVENLRSVQQNNPGNEAIQKEVIVLSRILRDRIKEYYDTTISSSPGGYDSYVAEGQFFDEICNILIDKMSEDFDAVSILSPPKKGVKEPTELENFIRVNLSRFSVNLNSESFYRKIASSDYNKAIRSGVIKKLATKYVESADVIELMAMVPDANIDYSNSSLHKLIDEIHDINAEDQIGKEKENVDILIALCKESKRLHDLGIESEELDLFDESIRIQYEEMRNNERYKGVLSPVMEDVSGAVFKNIQNEFNTLFSSKKDIGSFKLLGKFFVDDSKLMKELSSDLKRDSLIELEGSLYDVELAARKRLFDMKVEDITFKNGYIDTKEFESFYDNADPFELFYFLNSDRNLQRKDVHTRVRTMDVLDKLYSRKIQDQNGKIVPCFNFLKIKAKADVLAELGSLKHLRPTVRRAREEVRLNHRGIKKVLHDSFDNGYKGKVKGRDDVNNVYIIELFGNHEFSHFIYLETKDPSSNNFSMSHILNSGCYEDIDGKEKLVCNTDYPDGCLSTPYPYKYLSEYTFSASAGIQIARCKFLRDYFVSENQDLLEVIKGMVAEDPMDSLEEQAEAQVAMLLEEDEEEKTVSDDNMDISSSKEETTEENERNETDIQVVMLPEEEKTVSDDNVE